jgi:hypothetical protein
MQSLWPLLGIGVFASMVVVAMLFWDILNFDPSRPDLSLVSFKPIQAVSPRMRPAAVSNLPSPEFAEGSTVQIRRSSIIFTGPGINPVPAASDPGSRRGVVEDGLWQQGRWLYQVRLSPTEAVWVAESDLVSMQP